MQLWGLGNFSRIGLNYCCDLPINVSTFHNGIRRTTDDPSKTL